MRRFGAKRTWPAAICVAALALLGAAPAQGAASDPLFVYVPVPPPLPALPIPFPTGYFSDPCGVAADSTGNFYISDYYHHNVDLFKANDPSYKNTSNNATGYITQLTGVDSLDGPCELAFDATDHLYVNDYHRGVIKYNAYPSFGTGTTITGAGVDSEHPTGVAVDPATGNVYVDDRTYVAVFDSSGTPVDDGGSPLKIGVGSLQNGYGIAFSQYPGTAGYLYVPDAATNTVKVYDPATDKANPVDVIDASDTPNAKFISLRDAAVAVDKVTGEVYVVDNTQPLYTEKPKALVYVFDHTGAYEGQLKYMISDPLPAGLAVDNGGGATQSRVYVTSGNTAGSGVFAYPPGAATLTAPLPPTVSVAPSSGGNGSGTTASDPAGTGASTGTTSEATSVGAGLAAPTLPSFSSSSTVIQAETTSAVHPRRTKHHRHRKRHHRKHAHH